MYQAIFQTTFCASLLLLLYTYAGYQLLIQLLALIRDPIKPDNHTAAPDTTIVIAAHNEAPRIAARLQNLLATNHPPDKLHLLVVSDGSTDDTAAEIRRLNDPRITLIEQHLRQGKAHALNQALARATGEIIIFTDVRQHFTPDTIPNLVRHFTDLQIGAVSGELIIQSAATTTGSGVDLYWKLEKLLRHAEARLDSCIGCTGAVYAIRRPLYRDIPADTILDDVVIPMHIATQGYRVLFDPAAIALDPQTLEPEREKIRKRRTLAGNYQMLFRYPAWLLPWKNRLAAQLISHKYLRLAAPFLMLALFAANIPLASQKLYLAFLLGQILFYAAAIYGLTHPDTKKRWLSIPAGFVFLNWMSFQSLWHYLRQRDSAGWQKSA